MIDRDPGLHHALKIDQSFVMGVGANKEDEAIIGAILSMARDLGMRVVAEGIETERQMQFLVDRQCDEIQGFLFSRPLAPKDFGEFLDACNGFGRSACTWRETASARP